jgi:hypothetical protein
MIFNFNSKTVITHAFDESVFTELTTVENIAAADLTTIYGNGYITLKKTGGPDAQYLKVYIDGNTTPFTISMHGGGNSLSNYLRIYFQESIRFEPFSTHTFYYQTLLANVELPKKYNITQGAISKTTELSLQGRGKIIISHDILGTTYPVTVDGQLINMQLTSQFYTDIYFNESFKCTSEYELNYIAYVEIEK